MKIKDQFDKFERHKIFSNNEFKWTPSQKKALINSLRTGDPERNESETLKRAQDKGLVLHLQNLDSNPQKKTFVPNFLFFEIADELEDIEADVLKSKKISESKSFEDLILKVLDFHLDIFKPIMRTFEKNGFEITKEQLGKIKADKYAGQNALKITFYCPIKQTCIPGELTNAEGLCSRQNVWKNLFKAVFKQIQPYIPQQKYSFRPEAIEDIDECVLCINYREDDREREELDD